MPDNRIPSDTDFPIERALQVFLHGFAFTRSFTHPYERAALGDGVWMLHDAPRRRGGRRTAEVSVWRREPEEVAALLRETVTDRHIICVMTEGSAEAETIAAAYKRLGFRLMNREPLFVAATAGAESDGSVVTVTDAALAGAVAKAARGKQLLPAHLTDPDPPVRLFASLHEGRPVGWARSIRVRPDGASACGWVAGLYVAPEHRGQGRGRALMRALLADDARRGIGHSVLLASSAGARLYPHVGYHQIGLLVALAPPRE
jgi:GNAT superfamily N-acetyltransferase